MTRRLFPNPASASDFTLSTSRPGEAGLTPGEVLEVMERAADWQLAHPPKWEPLEWHNGAFYTGVMSLAALSGNPRFHDAMMKLGEDHKWQLGPRLYHADDHCVGQTYVDLYLRHGDLRMVAPLQERFDYILAHPKDNNLDFTQPDRRDRWSWCDALFMAPPAWVRLWSITRNQAYLDFALTQWWITSDYLYDKEEHLYFRDSTIFDKREKNGRKVFWSRGTGWVMAGIVRLLQALPATHPARARFVEQFRELAAKVIACQQPDGLWRASLLDPASYPMKEASGSGFYCYALAWGVNEGVLPREPCATATLKVWQALVGFVQPDGKLTHVQPEGFTPFMFDESSTEPFGVGAFLLAGSEVHRLLRQSQAGSHGV